MLIGIDGNEANVAGRVGSNVYAYWVIRGFYELEKREKRLDNSYIVYLKDEPLADLPREESWWKYKVVGPRRFWTRFGLPFALYTQKEKLDVFFTPGHYGPKFCPCPVVVCVLDTSYLSFGNYFKKDDLHKLKKWTADSVERAKKIITISENSKKDIVKYYKRKAVDVVVVYPGYDRKRYNIKTKSTKEKYKINRDYIIYVGTLQPRKNLIRLIEAFGLLKDTGLKLVIAGKKGWMYDEIFRKVKELGLEQEVIFTGYVDDKDLPYLMAGAKLFVLPSLYEGFGIPVIEAKAVGVVTVISKNSSLVEIGGKSSIFIKDAESVESIKKALERGLNLTKVERDETIKTAFVEIKKYSWENSARKIMEILETARA